MIAYYFPCTTATSLERNARRSGRARVPDVGIFSTAKVFQVPTPSEGFDELYRVLADDIEVPRVERVSEDHDEE